MAADVEAFLSEWHRIVANRDLNGLREILADDMTMGAPPYWQKLEGKDLIHHLLGVIISTIENFTYHREWISGRELALEFRGNVGEDELQGIDLISVGEDGRIKNLDVMIRPLNSLEALRDRVAPKMQEFLSA